MAKDINLRTSFDGDAELYHVIRPHYPEALFDTMVQTTHLHGNANLLEIGPGTGQATIPLAERGFEITAVELGANLANVAQKVLKNYGKVRVILGAFEEVELPFESFDLVFAATAFHWIRPEIRFSKPYGLLRSGGHLALIHTEHVSDEQGDTFVVASQPIYKKYRPCNDDKEFCPPRISEVKRWEVDEKLFEQVFFGAFPPVVRYTANEYTRLLNTYSPTLALEPTQRMHFLQAILDLINQEFGGSILRHFGMSLTIAKKSK